MESIGRKRPYAPSPVLDERQYDYASRESEQKLRSIREMPVVYEKRHPARHIPRSMSRLAELSSLRSSPYMFFHGETDEYEEASKEREAQRRKWDEQLASRKAMRTPGVASSLPPLVPPSVSPVLLDNIYDDLMSDDFSRGQVNRTVTKVLSKQQQVEKLRDFQQKTFRDWETADEPENMGIIRNTLMSITVVDPTLADGTAATELTEEMLVIPLEQLKTTLRTAFDVEADMTVDVFCRELSKNKDGGGHVGFMYLYKLFKEVCTGKEHVKHSVRACFKVFDTWDLENVPKRDLVALRGCKASAFTNGQSRAMAKALLDVFCQNPEMGNSIDEERFRAFWETKETLVAGFIEEIIRYIITTIFNRAYKRDSLLPPAHQKVKSLPSIKKKTADGAA